MSVKGELRFIEIENFFLFENRKSRVPPIFDLKSKITFCGPEKVCLSSVFSGKLSLKCVMDDDLATFGTPCLNSILFL